MVLKNKEFTFEGGLTCSQFFLKRGNSGLDIDGLFLSRGRDALYAIVKDMQLPAGRGILLPSFSCEDVYSQFDNTGLKLHYYHVKEDLTPDMDHIESIKNNCVAILLINYFGFLQPKKIYEKLRKMGLIIIENGTHSFLSTGSGAYGDYYFASMRKLLPLLDGAILAKKNKEQLNKVHLKKSMEMHKFRIFRALAMLIKTSDNKHPRGIKQWVIKELFSLAEKSLRYYSIPAKMSRISRNILSHVNTESISKVRRRNYIILQKEFEAFKDFSLVFKELPEGIVPYGFPVFVEKRTLWLNALKALKVQTAPLWNLSNVVRNQISQDHKIFKQTLLFPLGQDYSEDDIHYLIGRIKRLH